MFDKDYFNTFGTRNLPGHLGIVFTNGYLHAGAVVTLADTASGYGCMAHLPAGATGFTTVELKSNHLGTARDGTIACTAKPVHLGRTTQVWDAVVIHRETGKTIALFRCTQMILYPAAPKGVEAVGSE
jgi:1,4-dihydroxy-2-naphthoyl-CoA hydrolase